MINKQTKTLKIFEDFIIDNNLPKYKKETNLDVETFATQNLNTVSFEGTVTGFNSNRTEPQLLYSLKHKADLTGSFFNRMKYLIAKKFLFRSPEKIVETIPNYKDISEFFVGLKNSAEKLELKDEDLHFYKQLIQNADKLGQIALKEKLMQEQGRVMVEISMIKEKQVTFIPEEYVVKYYEKAKFSNFLHLNWIKNYTRIIPTEVIELKEKCDKFGWFDNYVILHFDRDGKSAEMTEKEKEKAKDPILFGVMKNSRNLYFIADWEDEYCDLTLSKMLNVLGKKSLTINNKSVKSRLNHL